MDVFEELIRDHRVTEQRFAEIEQTTDRELKRRQGLFRELRAGFESHELFEEEILYPEFDQLLSTKVAIGDAFEAHAELDGLLQEIEGTPANDAEWIERIRELKSRMQEHMRAEEEKIFPVARLELAKTRAEELGRRFQERTSAI
jgi:iron-sulfur cluster repair protein YtfE (RIC family)